MNYYEMNSDRWIWQYINNFKEKWFNLGFNVVLDSTYHLPQGVDHSILNTDEKVPTVRKFEFYVSLHLFFWQFHMGFKTK